jgi:hypothetical protein
LGHALGLSQALPASSLLTSMLLLSHFALMFVKLKLINLGGSDLRYLEISHLLSAHFVLLLHFFIRLLDTANFAFV